MAGSGIKSCAIASVALILALVGASHAVVASAANSASADRPLGILIIDPEAPSFRPAGQGPVPATGAPTAAAPAQPTPPTAVPARPQPPADDGPEQPSPALPEVAGEDALPVKLLADEMSFDQENGTVSAIGSVEVTYGERTLLADKVTYNQNTDIVIAVGQVTILEPTGETVFAEQVTLTGDLKEGLVRNIGVILADRSRLAAHGAKRSGGVVTELRQGVYSPCNLCEDDPDKAPLWQIKAVRVIHDQRSKTIEYRDAWLEVYGVPVAYTPYFIHPDPTIRRKAGFLAPGFGGSSDLGFVVRTPYFYPINESADITFAPAFSEEEGLLAALDYRHRFRDGRLDAEVSGINDSEDDFRGHIKAEGRMDLDETWRAGFDVHRATDDTYLRRFGFESPSVLESRVFAEGFRGRNYLAVNAFSFQDLRADSDNIDSPTVLPLVEFQHVGEPDRLGGNFTLDGDLLVIARDETGNDTRRLSLRPAWNRRFSDSVGNLFGLSAGVFADAYHVSDVSRPNGIKFSGVTGRVHPYAAADWRFPLVSDFRGASQSLEPIVQLVTSPNGGNPSAIPNEDSQEFEFDDTNLFEINRFGGIDRVEGGTRLNYGLRWGLFGPTGGNMTVLVGQTFRFAPDDTFAGGSGLEDDLSDIVMAVRLNPNETVNLDYRTQLSKDGFSARRHQLEGTLGVPLLRASTSYFFFEQQEGSEFPSREELNITVRSQLSQNWRTNLRAIRDLAADEMRSISADLVYEDECLVVTTRISRTFFSDRDLSPSDSFTINLLLKTLGQVTF